MIRNKILKLAFEKMNSSLTLDIAGKGLTVRHQLKPMERIQIMQATMTRIHDPAKALAFFEDKLAFTTGPVELERWIKCHENNLVVVDVREAEDFEKGHIPGAINLPKNRWDTLQGLSKDKTNVIYCYTQQCHLAANACVRFASRGYPVMELEGGFEIWKEHEFDIEEESANRLRKGGQTALRA